MKIRGIGGIFMYSNNAEALAGWYAKFLGIDVTSSPQYGAYYCEYRYKADEGSLISLTWSVIQANKPIAKAEQPIYCINYRVDDIAGFTELLKAKGVLPSAIESYPEGKFAYINDPDGNRLELWQPADDFFEKK